MSGFSERRGRNVLVALLLPPVITYMRSSILRVGLSSCQAGHSSLTFARNYRTRAASYALRCLCFVRSNHSASSGRLGVTAGSIDLVMGKLAAKDGRQPHPSPLRRPA
jgi:hypothetical protein